MAGKVGKSITGWGHSFSKGTLKLKKKSSAEVVSIGEFSDAQKVQQDTRYLIYK